MDKAYCFPNSLAHQSVPAHLLQSSIRRLQRTLPLSLFGEEEEERDEQASQDLIGLTENEGFGRKESNLNVKKGGIDDLISNLYVQNGSGPNSDINGSSNSSGAKLNEEEGNGDFDEEDDDGWEFKAAEPEQRGENENSKGQGVVEVAEVRAESSTFVNGGI
ncbi:PREDICTED: uncharacterized protein LOC101294084 [Fragaria vesca subsp. vesca]